MALTRDQFLRRGRKPNERKKVPGEMHGSEGMKPLPGKNPNFLVLGNDP